MLRVWLTKLDKQVFLVCLPILNYGGMDYSKLFILRVSKLRFFQTRQESMEISSVFIWLPTSSWLRKKCHLNRQFQLLGSGRHCIIYHQRYKEDIFLE